MMFRWLWCLWFRWFIQYVCNTTSACLMVISTGRTVLPNTGGGKNYIFAEVIKHNVCRCPGTTCTVTFDWSMMCSTSITENETWELTIKGACGNINQTCAWFCYIFSIVCPLGLTRPNWPSSRAMISRLTKSWMITCWSVGQIVVFA